MHPDDRVPYQSREALFEKIRRLSIDLDNEQQTVMKLKARIERYEALFTPVELPSEMTTEREKYLRAREMIELEEFARGLPV